MAYCQCENCRGQCKETHAFAQKRDYDFVNIIYVCEDCLRKLRKQRNMVGKTWKTECSGCQCIDCAVEDCPDECKRVKHCETPVTKCTNYETWRTV